MEGRVVRSPHGYVGVSRFMVGDLVEVLQLEEGLRGSWHPAVVIAVEGAKRLVEYEELLTEDGLQKLRERIPVGRSAAGDRRPPRPAVRSQNGAVLNKVKKSRTLLRPRPPKFSDFSPENWRRGFWVDCFCNDAWWEGVLVEDVRNVTQSVEVYFPEEEDQERILVSNMRVGLEWDEDSGHWTSRNPMNLSLPCEKKKINRISCGRGRSRNAIVKGVNNKFVRAIQASLSSKHVKRYCARVNSISVDRREGKRTSRKDTASAIGRHHNSTEKRLVGESCKQSSSVFTKRSSTRYQDPPAGVIEVGNENMTIVKCPEEGECDQALSSMRAKCFPGGCKQSNLGSNDGGDDGENPTLNSLKLLNSFPTGSKHNRDAIDGKKLPKVTRKQPSLSVGNIKATRMANSLHLHCHKNPSEVNMMPDSKQKISDGDMSARSRVMVDVVATSAAPNCKRSSLECELPIETVDTNGQKRRKLDDLQGGEAWTLHIPSLSAGLCREGGVSFPSETNAGPALGLRIKKRTALSEDAMIEQSADDLDGGHVDSDGAFDQEPLSKKSKGITVDLKCVSDGKGKQAVMSMHPDYDHDFKGRKKGKALKSLHVKKGKKSRGKGGCRLEVLLSAPGKRGDAEDKNKKRTILSWLIDLGVISENVKVRYLNRKKNMHCMGEGVANRDGILCWCCRKVLTLSMFEAHCGSKLHRPSANIFIPDGRSLSDCQADGLKRQDQLNGIARNFPEHDGLDRDDLDKDYLEKEDLDKSDDTCGICGDGGELICCDHCPSTFHLSCMGMQAVPAGDWFCPNCRCTACGASQFGSPSNNDELLILLCNQCEHKYHASCVNPEENFNASTGLQANWFCGETCSLIFKGLRGLVGTSKALDGGLSWTLLRSGAEDISSVSCPVNLDLVAEYDSKLCMAKGVMEECFRPMVDPRTKIDLLSQVLYNRRSDVSRLDYHGFYTMLLEKGDELVSVATIRVHGSRVAEMPLIGTRFQYRRQGMCRRLMNALEEMLSSLGVETLILPAVPELFQTWTGAFGFRPLEVAQRAQLVDVNIMAFPGTAILYKSLAFFYQECKLSDYERPLMPIGIHPLEVERVPRGKRGRQPREKRLLLNSVPMNPSGMDFTVAQDFQTGEGIRPNEETTDAGRNWSCSPGAEEISDLNELDSPELGSPELDEETDVPNEVVRSASVSSVDVPLLENEMPKADVEKTVDAGILDSVVPGHTESSIADSIPVKGFNSKFKRLVDKCYVLEDREREGNGASVVIRTTTRSKRKVKAPRWVADSLENMSKWARNPEIGESSNGKACGLKKKCRADVPALESATPPTTTTTTTTVTYRRRKTKKIGDSLKFRTYSENLPVLNLPMESDKAFCTLPTSNLESCTFNDTPVAITMDPDVHQQEWNTGASSPGTVLLKSSSLKCVIDRDGPSRDEFPLTEGSHSSRSGEMPLCTMVDDQVITPVGGKLFVRLKLVGKILKEKSEKILPSESKSFDEQVDQGDTEKLGSSTLYDTATEELMGQDPIQVLYSSHEIRNSVR